MDLTRALCVHVMVVLRRSRCAREKQRKVCDYVTIALRYNCTRLGTQSTHTRTHISFTYTHMHTFGYKVHTRTHTHTYLSHTHTHAHAHTHIHTRTHTHTHMHTRTGCVPPGPGPPCCFSSHTRPCYGRRILVSQTCKPCARSALASASQPGHTGPSAC
jgi:hypothetical protein